MENELKKIWKQCFRDSEEYINWYFDNIYPMNQVKVYKEKNIIGAIHENLYKSSFNSQPIGVKYLYAVGVLPENRGEGVMSRLFKEVIVDSLKKKEFVLTLVPVNEKIYQNYGFEYISFLARYTIPFDTISAKKRYIIEKITKKSLNSEVMLELNEIYEQNMDKDCFYLKRDINLWKKFIEELFFENGELYVVKNEGKLYGYLMLYKNENIVVKEIFYKNRECLETILFLLKGFSNYYSRLIITAKENEILEELIIEKKRIKKEIISKLQGRVIDVELCFKHIFQNEKTELKIKVKDKMIERNNGTFKIKNGSIEKIEEEEVDLEIKIDTLTKLIFGVRSFEELDKVDEINLKNDKLKKYFSKKFIKKYNYFNQEF